jgi:hypothetical protein
MIMYGVGAATFLTIQTRLILMYDAGYPAYNGPVADRTEKSFILKFFSIF